MSAETPLPPCLAPAAAAAEPETAGVPWNERHLQCVWADDRLRPAALATTGGLPVRVRAFCHEGKWHDIEVEDDVTAYLEYENGATGVFVSTTGDAPGTNRLEISGELGKLVLEEGKLRWWRLRMPEPEVRFSSPESFGRIAKIMLPKDYLNYRLTGVHSCDYSDAGGMLLWFGVREPSPGMFVRIEDKTGAATAPMRRELRIAEAANWTDQTLPREANRAFPTAAAVAAGFKGDPAGEFATRYQTPALLREGDEFVPLLVAKDSEGRDVASASITRLAGGGAVIVSGAKNSGAGSAGEDGQARFLVRAMAMAFAEGVEQFFWYEFWYS